MGCIRSAAPPPNQRGAASRYDWLLCRSSATRQHRVGQFDLSSEPPQQGRTALADEATVLAIVLEEPSIDQCLVQLGLADIGEVVPRFPIALVLVLSLGEDPEVREVVDLVLVEAA